MEYSAFRDYCKAENSEDEDANRDLQSRLYAEVYYTSNNGDNKSTISNIKLETYNVNKNLHDNASTSKVSSPHDNFINSNTDKNNKNTCPINDFAEDDNKSYIKPVSIANEIEFTDKDTNKKDNSNALCTKASKCPNDNIKDSRNNRELTMWPNLKFDEFHSYNIEDMKPQLEVENKQLNSIQCSNNETTTDHSFYLNCVKLYTDNNTNKNPIVTNTEAIVNNDYDNILKKYEFSKLFINKLYLEKYETLEKRLQGKETDREGNFQNKDYQITDVVENNRNHGQEMLDNYMTSACHSELHSKYQIFSKAAKAQKPYSANVTILSSETSSDSEDSILEVPIPPKPQPPIINLKDSDESSDASSISSDTDEEHLINRKEKNDLSIAVKKRSSIIDQDSDSKTSDVNSGHDTTITEDIMLNCTEVQRAASTVKEIMDSSKTAHLAQYSDNDKSDYEKKQSILESEIYSKCLNEHTYDKHNMPIVNLPSKTINDSSVVYERDKDESINFTDDVMVSNFINTNKLPQNRKRHYENDMEPRTSVEHGKYVGDDSKRSKLDTQQCTENGTNQELEQERFDMQRIQSNMSKDPRLWVILDEDLMPDLIKRQRYWNVKCNNCHRSGHLRHKCPEPYKPIRCHICGTQGHMETRCPHKMCLTCGKKQQTFRQTCEFCRILYCDMCKAIGHKSTECPDLWRRFHQTTQMTEINIPENLSEVMKPADLLYCCNCSRRGHDSSTCREYRWSQHFPTPSFVSNYTDGPACEVQADSGNIAKDVIPLKEKKLSVFPKGADTIDSKCLVYSYGTFHTNLPNGKEIVQKLVGFQVDEIHLKNVINGHISPCFLDDLMQKVNFEIKIFYGKHKNPTIRVRSTGDACRFILEIFIFWLKLEDTDKHLSIRTNFPWKTKVLCKMLEKKYKELHNIVGDPRDIYNQIMQLKTSVTDIQNATSTSEKILHLQSSLNKIYHTKPKLTVTAMRFQEVIKTLRKSSKEYVDVRLYFDAIVAYNKIFVPRTLNDTEMDNFLKKYTGKVNSKLPKQQAKKKSKSKKDTLYSKFLRSLELCSASRKTKVVNNVQNSESCSSKNTNRRKMEVPPKTTNIVEYVSALHRNTDTEIVTQHADPVSKETLSTENSVTEPTDVNRIECIELPGTKETSSSKETTNVENNRTLSTLSNVIALEKSIHSNEPANQSSTDHLPSVSLAQTKNSKDNVKNDIEIIDCDATTVKVSESNKVDTVDLESSVPKKKKNKRKKAKLGVHNNSDVIEIDTKTIDTSMKHQANQVIRVALDFNVPYMNKAVEEIKKKLNDKTIKQEHIDTLQRLINLENEHRKYVSSFCNYLQ